MKQQQKNAYIDKPITGILTKIPQHQNNKGRHRKRKNFECVEK